MLWMIALWACRKPVESHVVPASEVIIQEDSKAPQKTQGVTSVENLGFIDLRTEFPNLEESLFFRLRRLEIAPNGSVGFHEHNNQAYCEHCYTNIVLPKCRACEKPITDRTMKAMGNQWHVSCFVCKVIQVSHIRTMSGQSMSYNSMSEFSSWPDHMMSYVNKFLVLSCHVLST